MFDGSLDIVDVDLKDRQGVRVFVHGLPLLLEPEHLRPQAYLPTGNLIELEPEMEIKFCYEGTLLGLVVPTMTLLTFRGTDPTMTL